MRAVKSRAARLLEHLGGLAHRTCERVDRVLIAAHQLAEAGRRTCPASPRAPSDPPLRCVHDDWTSRRSSAWVVWRNGLDRLAKRVTLVPRISTAADISPLATSARATFAGSRCTPVRSTDSEEHVLVATRRRTHSSQFAQPGGHRRQYDSLSRSTISLERRERSPISSFNVILLINVGRSRRIRADRAERTTGLAMLRMIRNANSQRAAGRGDAASGDRRDYTPRRHAAPGSRRSSRSCPGDFTGGRVEEVRIERRGPLPGAACRAAGIGVGSRMCARIGLLVLVAPGAASACWNSASRFVGRGLVRFPDPQRRCGRLD